MAGFLSTYLANKMLDFVLNGTAFTINSTIYCALFTAPPTAAGGGTEVTGGSYARVPVVRNTTQFPLAAAQIIRNASAITFPTPTADWGSVVGAAWYDAASAGNLLMYGEFTIPRTILNGDAAPSILANGGTHTLE